MSITSSEQQPVEAEEGASRQQQQREQNQRERQVQGLQLRQQQEGEQQGQQTRRAQRGFGRAFERLEQRSPRLYKVLAFYSLYSLDLAAVKGWLAGSGAPISTRPPAFSPLSPSWSPPRLCS